MNNVIVYCELDDGRIADVSLELLTKGRELANSLGVLLEAVAIGSSVNSLEKIVAEYGARRLYIADDKRLENFQTLPYERILCDLFRKEQPQIVLFGATPIGRDLAPRVSSKLHSGLTADCTSLEIGEYRDAKTKQVYENLLYQIRPAFGGNIIATIVNPDCRPQMATVREGVMRRQPLPNPVSCQVVKIPCDSLLVDADFVVKLLKRHVEPRRVEIKNSPIIVSGGYGVGSREGFGSLFELAKLLGGQVGASRAAVDAGFADHERQVGQTGVTVRPKLYFACGISGQVQHTAGMIESQMIIAINNDPNAPIHQLADYSIIGDVHKVISHFIKAYKKNSK